MRKTITVLLSLFALNVVWPAGAQETEKKKSEADAVMEYYAEQAKPVAEHKRLAELAGPWKTKSNLWFGSGDPVNVSGSASGKMILGGRFLELHATAKEPLHLEAITLMGFDRRTGEYTLIGLDTGGTYYITAAGKWDEAKKAVVMHGSYLQPPANTEQKYHFVWATPSPREHVLTLFFNMSGKDVQVAETRYTRE
jgi:hypothetical protein